jgi:hypothetical protein
MIISYSRHPRFEQQIKKLLKKYRTLEADLEIAKIAAIEFFHVRGKDNRSIWLVPSLDHENIKVYKIKKFACKSLPGKGVRSGIRVVYALIPQTKGIIFLEIYYKEKDNTDMDYNFAKNFVNERTNK